MRVGLTRMAEAWHKAVSTNQTNQGASLKKELEEYVEDQTCEAGLSIKISGLLPLISFLWSVYKMPESLIHSTAKKKK